MFLVAEVDYYMKVFTDFSWDEMTFKIMKFSTSTKQHCDDHVITKVMKFLHTCTSE